MGLDVDLGFSQARFCEQQQATIKQWIFCNSAIVACSYCNRSWLLMIRTKAHLPCQMTFTEHHRGTRSSPLYYPVYQHLASPSCVRTLVGPHTWIVSSPCMKRILATITKKIMATMTLRQFLLSVFPSECISTFLYRFCSKCRLAFLLQVSESEIVISPE